MFSQFVNAVETLAQQQPRRSGSADLSDSDQTRSSSRERDASAPRRSGTYSSTAQLADSALQNIRKTLATQRATNTSIPTPNSSSSKDSEILMDNGKAVKTVSVAPGGAFKARLEDRLRASFAGGELSNESTGPPVETSPMTGETPRDIPQGELSQKQVAPTSPTYRESHHLRGLDVTQNIEPDTTEDIFTPSLSALPADVPAELDEPAKSGELEARQVELPLNTEATLPTVEELGIVTPPQYASESLSDAPTQMDGLPTLGMEAGMNPQTVKDHSKIDLLDAASHSDTGVNHSTREIDVETLQARLKLVEQRFTDVSTSFKRLQAERVAADHILQEFQVVNSVTDIVSLREHFKGNLEKTTSYKEELKRLEAHHRQQEERMEELRDMHRLESHATTEQMDKLRGQVEEAEKLLQASNETIAHLAESSRTKQAETEKLKQDVSKMQGQVKEEEEKRVKAINLLKTVRARLVKAEKERDEAMQEFGRHRDQEKEGKEKEEKERQRLQGEADRVKKEKEKEVHALMARMDKELSTVKERHEKEVTAIKGQFELEAITSKATYAKEIMSRDTTISSLQEAANRDAQERHSLLDQLQLRHAEIESTRAHSDALEGQLAELSYQLHEASDRAALLAQELTDMRLERETGTLMYDRHEASSEALAQFISTAESKHDAKMAEMRRRLEVVEQERTEAETEWSKRWAERAKEVESLKRVAGSSTRTRDERDGLLSSLKEEIVALHAVETRYKARIDEMEHQLEGFKEVEANTNALQSEKHADVKRLDAQLQETRVRESQLRASNKMLREELRKVQSSAALLERQRNPGVGFWSGQRNQNESTALGMASPISPFHPSRPGSPALYGSSNTNSEDNTTDNGTDGNGEITRKQDEEVNLEYLRNVILQFLEHKEMRPNLVRVLSIILQFTPQETRRLIAKV